ncbi:MAG: aldose 1-epimerase family protein [Chitinophagaceae bacterium]
MLLDSGWHNKISNNAQIGGIETAVIDNGPGRGTRFAWINTGTGFRYKVIIDRGMDIGDAFFNQYSIAWLSHTGITYPQPFSDRGLDWLKTFGGGLLTTCGLDHVGGPESDLSGERGLHGQISNIPAELESIIQPDPMNGKMEMSITGTMKQTKIFGPRLELKRTISGRLGSPSINIQDEVVNRGNTAAPHMILYHFNFGWPLVDEGTDIIWKGNWQPRNPAGENRIFRQGNNFKKCPPPLEDHNGSGEEVGIVDIEADESGRCFCGLHNSRLGVGVRLRFQKNQLPWLTNWQHWGHGEYVTGLEPGTNPPIGQSRARDNKELILLQPRESRTYNLEIEVSDNKELISELIR